MTVTDVLRRFNRTYTQRIGALDESFLGLGLPLGSARLVFEVGEAGATVRDLRARLGLDSGHLARQLRRLEDDGLVRVAPDAEDRRRRTVRLTAKGRGLPPAAGRPLRAARRATRRAADQPAAGAVDRGAGDRRPAGAGGDRRHQVGAPRLTGGEAGGAELLRRARRAVPRPASTPATTTTTSTWPPAPARSSSPPATASRSRAAACRSSSRASARSSGCGCTRAGGARASGHGCCATSSR